MVLQALMWAASEGHIDGFDRLPRGVGTSTRLRLMAGQPW